MSNNKHLRKGSDSGNEEVKTKLMIEVIGFSYNMSKFTGE